MISILIPSYNGAEFIKTAIISALGQDVEKEIVVVDDASTDDTAEIAKSFGVTVIQNSKNVGLVANWNRALLFANGDWIKFLHQDDWLEPGCLRKMIAHDKRPFIVCKRIPVQAATESLSAGQFRRLLLSDMTRNHIGEPSCVMFHRDVLRLGRFNESLCQIADWEFFARIAANYGITYVSNAEAYYRVHDGSATKHNFKSNMYRMTYLDAVIFLYELIHNPWFLPVRITAWRLGINLKKRLIVTYRNAQMRLQIEPPCAIREWQRLKIACPGIKDY